MHAFVNVQNDTAVCCNSEMTISNSVYFLQTIMAYNAVAAISIFIIITGMISLAALLLPIETRGRAMKVTAIRNYCIWVGLYNNNEITLVRAS